MAGALRARADAVGLVLARHAESELNAERRFCGRTDVGLSLRGRAQAQAMALKLQAQLGAAAVGSELAGVYASPLRRAVDTARAVAEPRRVAGLEEVDQGELEGLNFAEGMARFPDFFRAWREDPAAVRIPGGEALPEARARVHEALLELAGAHAPGSMVLVVGHQLSFACVLAHLRGAGAGAWTQHALRNAAWAQVWSDGETLWCDPA